MNKLTRRSRYVVSSKVLGVIALAAASVAGSAASAQSVWTGAGNGTAFSDAANWGIAPVSGTTLSLTFNTGATASNDLLTQPLVLNSLTNSASGAVSISDGTLAFGGTAPRIVQDGSASLTISSGILLNTSTAISGSGAGAVNLTGALSSTTSAVGLTKTGTFALNINTGGGSLGFVAANGGTTTFSGGTYALTSQAAPGLNSAVSNPSVALSVGNASGQAAHVIVNGGTQLITGNVYAGNATGSFGRLDITGTGTLVRTDLTTFTAGRFGGYAGTGTITVSDGARVEALGLENRGTASTTSVSFSGGATAVFGQVVTNRGSNSNFTLNVDGAGTVVETQVFGPAFGGFTVGEAINARAQLNITNGGRLVVADTSSLSIGSGAGAIIDINVSAGSNLDFDYGAMGASRNGRVNMIVEGNLTASGLTFDTALGGTVFGNQTPEGSTNTYTVRNGGVMSFVGVRVGHNPGQTNAFTTSVRIEAGGTLNASDNFWIGSSRFSQAGVTVSAGGSLQVDTLNVGMGFTGGGNGTLLVDGGTVNVDNLGFGFNAIGSFYTGADAGGATGTVIVRNGGTFNSAGGFLVGRNTTTNGVSGTVVVTGTGSTFTTSGFAIGLNTNSSGNLTVSNSGTLTITTDGLDLATAQGTSGNVLVTSGGTLNIGGGGISSGGTFGTAAGTGSVVIDGGTVSVTGTSFIGLSDVLTSPASTIDLRAGTLTTQTIVLAANGGTNTSTGRLLVSGGTATVNGTLQHGSLGSVSVTGGTLTTSFLLAQTAATNGLVNVSGTGVLNLDGSTITGTSAVVGTTRATLTGNGTINSSGPLLIQDFTGNNSAFNGTLNVTGAGARFAGPAAGGGRIFNGANLIVGADSFTTFFTVNTEGSATRTPANAVVLNSLSIAPTGFVNLVDNDIILKSGVASITTIRGFVSSWLASTLTPDLVGLGTSFREYVTNTTTGTAYTTLAVFPNNTGPAGTAFFETYDGVAVTASDLIVKFTYLGDTNIDGVLDGKDLANVIEGFSNGLTGWQWGDVDYSGGAVNVADVQAFLEAYNFVTGLPSQISFGNGQGFGGTSGAIPEPAALGLLAAAVPFASRRRRRA